MAVMWNDKLGKWYVLFKINGRRVWYGHYLSRELAEQVNELVMPEVKQMQRERPTKKRKHITRTQKKWTMSDLEYLKQNRHLPYPELGKILGCSRRAIYARLKRLEAGQ